VELDRTLAEHLPQLVPAEHLEVVSGDALQFDPADRFPADYKLVANLPYQITSPVFHRYLIELRRPSVMVVMVQHEVAQRITGSTSGESYLSILVKSVGTVEIARKVPPGAFFPRPNVSSSVLRVRPFSEPALDRARHRELLGLVRAGFSQPRKTIANSLAQGLGRPRSEIERLIESAGLELTARPHQLRLEDWSRLSQARRGS
jgi:16S rRNA (adenine1518-N6/adenine1519-N6)-dimethyltransferase